jgi:hypothetical protein
MWFHGWRRLLTLLWRSEHTHNGRQPDQLAVRLPRALIEADRRVGTSAVSSILEVGLTQRTSRTSADTSNRPLACSGPRVSQPARCACVHKRNTLVVGDANRCSD